ncbi:ABC transporter ATP-binding protein [Niveispirillum sp. KHB5.9]|uniref:ABC transporter ATP-binding protein n=1 Tax=Niveispirillum sp. KHB5.9 TaxID=3400269 RepID=UPI003A84D1F0
MPLLDIKDLSVTFATGRGPFRAVDGIDLSIEPGEVLGIVGESGSGKSVTSLAVLGLLADNASVTARTMAFDGQDLLTLHPKTRRRLNGGQVAMIFQEPMSSLNPCFTVGFQIGETLAQHEGLSGKALRKRSIDLLEQVGIPAPETRLSAFPHQLSGGMSQRVMIAMAIACNPRLLIADEPTTALDVTIQRQILDLLRDLQRQRGMAMILITHDMGVVAECAHRVQVMYAGQVVENRPADQLFDQPRHPYTAALLDALPERAVGRRRLPTIAGTVPGVGDRPAGCLFQPRCTLAEDRCGTRPAVVPDGAGWTRCVRAEVA